MNTTLTPALSLKGRGGGDVIVVEDVLDSQCVRRVHLMANEVPVSGVKFQVPCFGGEWVKEAGVWHLRAEWAYRGVWEVDAACKEGKFRRLVIWNLSSTSQVPSSKFLSVREGARQAADAFERCFGFEPKYLFVKRLPKGAENCMDVEGMILLEAEWMLERCVAVGGRR